MTRARPKPRKSLRTLLMLWFLLFSVVPLAFITGYSLVKYEQAIDQELTQRLNGNQREIAVIISEFEAGLIDRVRRHSTDNSLIYYLSRSSISQARSLATQWMRNHFVQRLSIFNKEGRLEVALYRDQTGDIKRNQTHESSHVYLSEVFLEKADDKNTIAVIDFRGNKSMDLIVHSKIRTSKGFLVGYIEEILELDGEFLDGLKKRLNLEIAFFSRDHDRIVASHDDLAQYRPEFFLEQAAGNPEGLFDLTIQGVPFGVMVTEVKWGDKVFYMATAASKQAIKSVLQNVNYAFFTVVGAIVFLLIILSLIISRILLKPLSELVEAIKTMDPDKGTVIVETNSDTELGVLTDSFNEMFRRVHHAQKELRSKIQELEKANSEIRDTQAKLVHTAKMASLGQLVAGIAHELNNPIGFIYSNMGHLRDYSQKLINLVGIAEKEPGKLPAAKEKAEFEYIIKDMPKLISSCEDGARRTRDIVLGLRNFSRLEEAKIKDVDLREGLENTLGLLTGELKNRIKVHKEFAQDLPKVRCYPSQLNQVFMNILSNAAQAIAGEGEIFLKVFRQGKDHVVVSIRDSGKGMAPGTVEKIFDPFFTTKTLGQGTGLGLSISYGIVQNHGGDIQVKSEQGKGTEFIITIPTSGPI